MMKPRDRFLTALNKGIPDRVPIWELIIDEPVLSTILRKEPTKTTSEKLRRYCELVDFLNMDGVTWGEDQLMKKSGDTLIDEWGIV